MNHDANPTGAEHPFVRRTRAALEKIDAELADVLRRDAERDALRRKGVRLKPELTGLARTDVREGGVIVPPHDVMTIVVTPAMRERALTISEMLIKHLNEVGMKVWLEEGKVRVGTKLNAFTMRISEVAEKRSGAVIPFAPYGWVATGRLRVTLREGPVGDFRIRDEDGSTVESKAADLVAYVKRATDEAPARAARYAEWHDAYEAERKLKTDAATVEADKILGREIDVALGEDLVQESQAWQRAETIRRYVDSILACRPDEERVRAWAKWAMQIADEMDPTLRRLKLIERDPVAAGGTIA